MTYPRTSETTKRPTRAKVTMSGLARTVSLRDEERPDCAVSGRATVFLPDRRYASARRYRVSVSRRRARWACPPPPPQCRAQPAPDGTPLCLPDGEEPLHAAPRGRGRARGRDGVRQVQ